MDIRTSAPFGDLLGSGAAYAQQIADLSPGSAFSHLTHRSPLELSGVQVAVGQFSAKLAGTVVALNGIVDCCHLCDGGLDGSPKRFCHARSVSAFQSIYKGPLTPVGGLGTFNTGLKSAAHSYRTQSVGRCPTTQNGPDTTTPTSWAGPHHQAL